MLALTFFGDCNVYDRLSVLLRRGGLTGGGVLGASSFFLGSIPWRPGELPGLGFVLLEKIVFFT